MADEEPTPEMIAQAIKGLSDEELKSQIEGWPGGAQGALERIFAGMQEAFDPQKAKGVNAVVQWDVSVNGDVKSWTVKMEDGTCATSEGGSDNPKLTFQVSLLDFIRMIFRQADGTQLFMSGKLKLKGDMMFAMQYQNYFNPPA